MSLEITKLPLILKPLFPKWKTVEGSAIGPYEKKPFPGLLLPAFQQVLAMFGSTVLAPLLMGFDPNAAVLASGFATLIFFVITQGRVPSYLGSSFAFIGVVVAATGYAGSGPNPRLAIAAGGVVAAGLAYALVGVLVWAGKTGWLRKLFPRPVTGAIVTAIGLNLAAVAAKGLGGSTIDTLLAVLTIVLIFLIAAYSEGVPKTVPIVLGLIITMLIYVAVANGIGLTKPLDWTGLQAAPWLARPTIVNPVFDPKAMVTIGIVFVILVIENLGHLKAITGMTRVNLDPYMGRAFVGDGVATVMAGFLGAPGMTTYAENMGVMSITKNFSTRMFLYAALFAIALGFCPKFGAVIRLLPGPVLGGLSVTVFGMIAMAGVRIWKESEADFADVRVSAPAGTALILGAGDFTVNILGIPLAGIATATIAAVGLYWLLNLHNDRADDGDENGPGDAEALIAKPD